MEGVSESQLVRPDEYSYEKLNVHSPSWACLLFSRLNALPPQIQVPKECAQIFMNFQGNDATMQKRGAAVASPLEKKRNQRSFLPVLFGTLASFDANVRM